MAKHAFALLLVTVVSTIVFLPGAARPSLFEDEWAAARAMAYGIQACPDSSSVFLRPLRGCFRLLQYKLFGLDVRAFHFVTLALRTLTAMLFYVFLSCIVPQWKLFNVLASLLFVVYPTMFFYPFFEGNYQYVSYVLFLFGSVALCLSVTKGSWALLGIGLAFMTFSLLFYESVLGLMIGLSLLLFFRCRRRSIIMFTASSVLIFLAVGFMGGRWVTQLNQGITFGHSTGDVLMRLSPIQLIIDLVRAYWINIFRGWLDGLYHVVGGRGDLPYRSVVPYMIAVAGLVFITLLLTVLVRRRSRRISLSDSFRHHWVQCSLQKASAVVAALAAIGLGYWPSLVGLSPGLNYGSSRSNLLPAMGAAALVTLALWAIADCFRVSRRSANAVFIGLTVPLIFLGGLVHLSAQHETNVSWGIQKAFWQRVFSQVPDWESESIIILTLPDASERYLRFGAAPFSIYREAFGGAMGMMYGHKEGIQMSVVYDADYMDLKTTQEGFVVPLPYSTRSVMVPFERAVVLRYRQESSTLDVVLKARLRNSNGSERMQPLCSRCVRLSPAESTNWRSLLR